MSKKKNKNNKDKGPREPRLDLHPEARKTIGGIIMIIFALVLSLSYFNKAGVFGMYVYQILHYILGAGFLFFIILLFASAFLFFFSHRQKVYASVVVGILIILVSLLGLFHIVSPQQQWGGILGKLIAYPLDALLGFWAGVLVLFGLIIIGIVVMFNISVAGMLRKKEEENANLPQVVAPPLPPEIMPQAGLPEAIKQKNLQTQGKSKEIAEKPVLSAAIFAKTKRAKTSYPLPPLDLLEEGHGTPSSGDIKAYSAIIKRTLENFGIPVEMGEINIGPTVTQYTLKPAEGVKLAKLTGLRNDLALALAAHPIRIEAPIPGRSLVGIEIPNRVVSLVRLRNVLEAAHSQESQSLLTFPLGYDVAGSAIMSDLSRLPHLLIAGATGSGKSVGIHALITSLLFRNYPTTLKFLIIDPKRVELSVYEDIPHLLSPVVVEPVQAVNALRWATKEMDRRYKLLSSHKTRDIVSYNNKVAGDEKEEFLPFLVIVIDELADLMSGYAREVEGSIVRLAQMARAVGIHLVIATQRPSVEVITGLIKANITSRIAFQVASQIDSRTILDTAGAETLLGNGDMLYLSADSAKPRRIQGCYVSEKEVKKVVNYLQETGWESESAEQQPDFSVPPPASAAGDIMSGDSDDPLFHEAKKMVIESQKASATYLQRRLKVGYSRAARLLDLLEEDGVVGPGDGAKARQIYLKPEGGFNNLPDSLPGGEADDNADNMI